jgi:hypothetical protein
MTVYAIPAAGNTGTVTINVNGLGSVAVTKNGSAALSGGELLTGAVAQLQYDGTRFQVLNGLPGWIDNGSVLTTLPGRTVKMGTTAPSSAPSGSLATGGNHYLPGSLGTGNVQAGGGVWGYGIFADSAGSATANSAISGAGSTVLGGASAMITGAPPSPGQIYWMSNWYCPVVGCDYFLRNGGSAGLWMNITDQGGNRGEGFAGDLIEVTAPAGTAGTHIPWIQSRHVYAATRHTVLGPFGTADNGVDTLQVVGSVAATSPGISCLQYPCKVGSISATYTATTSTIPLVSSTNGGLYRADYYLWSSSTYSGVGGTCTIQLAVSSNGTYGTSRTSTPILLTGASDINGSMVFQLGASGTIVGNVTIVAASPTGNCNIAISAQQVQ